LRGRHAGKRVRVTATASEMAGTYFINNGKYLERIFP